MRITWLETDVIEAARQALRAQHPDWTAHFMPAFTAPPAPPGLDTGAWPRIAEHVARAERVSQDIRERGLGPAIERFGDSGHAIELATLLAAAVQVDQVTYELLAKLLCCEVDELITYGVFLELLHNVDKSRHEQALGVYEGFCKKFAAANSDLPMWRDRVNTVRDGLANFYVICGRHETGHELFLQRYEEETATLLVALTASRVFLQAGALGRAILWLGLGAERADALGRDAMAKRLRDKQAALRKRQS